MASAKKEWSALPVEQRLGLVTGRISAAQSSLYNLYLTELEGHPVNEDERARLTKALDLLAEEQARLQAEMDEAKAKAEG